MDLPQSMMSGGMDQGPNLWSILVNTAFGFAVGLMLFLGPAVVIAYGSKIAQQLLKASGYGAQMSMYGLATQAAPYIILTPLAGIVVKQLSGVRSLKGFLFFAGAVAVGILIAYFTKGSLGINA